MITSPASRAISRIPESGVLFDTVPNAGEMPTSKRNFMPRCVAVGGIVHPLQARQKQGLQRYLLLPKKENPQANLHGSFHLQGNLVASRRETVCLECMVYPMVIRGNLGCCSSITILGRMFTKAGAKLPSDQFLSNFSSRKPITIPVAPLFSPK